VRQRIRPTGAVYCEYPDEERDRMTTAELETTDLSEIRERYDQLREVGYSWGAALRLASASYVDIGLAAELLRRGCPAETAVRILL
jgi:hypothetical protein